MKLLLWLSNFSDFLMPKRGALFLIGWAFFLYFGGLAGHPILEIIFVFLCTVPFILPTQPKLILSKNIAFMSVVSFLSIPVFITLLAMFTFKVVTIQLLLVSICGTSTLMYLALLIKHKVSDSLLENLRISFDIIRTIFAVSLGFITVYSLSHNDFSFFDKVIVNYESKNVDELKKIMQLISQSIALPFVISSSLFKVLTDWLVLMKKRGQLQKWFSTLNKVFCKVKTIMVLSHKIMASKQIKE